jgi:hypothetical protein
MARFLSDEWFAAAAPDSAPATSPVELVIRQVVTGGPEGDVHYLVVVAGDRAWIERPAPPTRPRREADLTITNTWATATAIAKGELSAQRALMEGRLRVSGNLTRLYRVDRDLAGLDAVPPAVRAATTY